MHGSEMTYCGAYLTPPRKNVVPNTPPRLQRQNAYDGAAEQFTTPPRQNVVPNTPPRHNVEPRRMSVREQEIRFIEENVLVAFCHGG